ncbi:MAG: malto-oligosyltrehalose synthase, partial [Gammaproteobacteria bacterium]
KPSHASPYSPSSRRFLNVLYIDVEAVPDLAECTSARARVENPGFQARLWAQRSAELVDYEGVAATKLQVLDLLYRHFREAHLRAGSGRGLAFRAYQRDSGEALRQHALFEALQERFHREDPEVWGWPAWPEPYRDPASRAVAAFAVEQEKRIEYFEYLQWQAELQLERAGRRALELRLGVGLYLDLAVGVDGGGAEAWADQDLYAFGAHIGCPPDELNHKGQDWGLPPLHPAKLREAAYAPWIAALRANMRHAGALRIDHAVGLMRLYWVPPQMPPTAGAYVHYPFADMLGILALESVRTQCLIVGEDLGTMPDEVKEALAALGVLSYRLLYFEKAPDGSFKRPEDYPEQALVATGTHDLATLAGYWQGLDLKVRETLELFPTPEVREQQLIGRAEDRARLLAALEQEGLLPPEVSVHPGQVYEMTRELARAIHLYLARTRAKIMVFQIEDVFGQREQVNLPATVDQYPNWRRRLPFCLEEWTGDPRLKALAGALREAERLQAQPIPAVPTAHPIETRIPRATYRLQFNGGFTFAKATEILGYLDALGISHVYASPYLKARPGSAHGYDIIDHNALNPEIGTREEFALFVKTLKAHGMGQILDLVPNHMGVLGADNSRWLDVLENGPAAAHARYFDIDWQSANEALRGKLLLPVLDDHYGVVLENGELNLLFDREAGTFSVYYHEHRFSIDPNSYPTVLGHRMEFLTDRLGAEDPRLLEYQSLITAFGHLPGRSTSAPEALAERQRDKEIHKRQLADLCRRSPHITGFVEKNARAFNGKPGDPASVERLHGLLEAQAYRPCHWRVACDEINYRRFFDINDLAALRMEDPGVFEATHRLVLKLVGSGQIDGLRVDHPDGLYDPLGYLQRLQGHFSAPQTPEEAVNSRLDAPLYLVVEKILAPFERLPEGWPVYGTTGYDFANLVNGLFVDPAAEARMEHIYAGFTGERIDFAELIHRSKRLIMKTALTSEINVLANQLARITRLDRRTRDYTLNNLRDALLGVIACFPVYRTYIADGNVAAEDRRYVDWAVSVAKNRNRAVEVSIFDFIRAVLLTETAGGSQQRREAILRFAMKFQQLTGPVMAKGVEDTCCYIYNRLVSLNEVGADPRHFGTSVAAFHHANHERARAWPHAMLASSTHDSKRSEDVRARIDVLSELPDAWQRALQRWRRINRYKRRMLEAGPAPSRNDEYLLYQTLIGVWPLELLDGPLNGPDCERLRQRVQSYMLKATREAKIHTSWINPNAEYEEALAAFVQALFEHPGKNRFLADFLPFQRRTVRFGLYNSLSQTLLKLTAPGVPDTYQGNEIWDFSLVDPDNRRPVDYRLRQGMLETLGSLDALPCAERLQHLRSLLASMQDGRVKLYLMRKTLRFRAEEWPLFRDGDYRALNVAGPRSEHVCAFARCREDKECVIIVPRLIAGLLGRSMTEPLGSTVWEDTCVELPAERRRSYINIFTGEWVAPEPGTPRLALAKVFAHFPVALLR